MIKSRIDQEADPTWQMLTGMISAGFYGRLINRPSLVLAAKRYGPGTYGAEIGVADGDLSQIILDNMSPNKLYLIDPWMIYPDYAEELLDVGYVGDQYKRWYDQDTHDNVYNHVMKKFGNNPIISIMRGMSEDMASNLPDNHLEWAYIDGSHKEKYVYKDLVSWWPKIKAGGMLCGHDFTFPGIPPALERFSKEMNLIVWPYGGDWWINK